MEEIMKALEALSKAIKAEIEKRLDIIVVESAPTIEKMSKDLTELIDEVEDVRSLAEDAKTQAEEVNDDLSSLKDHLKDC